MSGITKFPIISHINMHPENLKSEYMKEKLDASMILVQWFPFVFQKIEAKKAYTV